MIYAIDFGTTHSLLAATEKEKTYDPIPLDPLNVQDPTILRSLLYFPDPDNVFYGARAIEEFIKNEMHGRFLRSFKKFLPNRSFIGTWVDNRPLNLEDIIGNFLREMKRRADEHFDREVDSVVLGRPAKFAQKDDVDRFAQGRLLSAAKRAGFQHVEFFPEPTAAALGYGMNITDEKILLVADFGGGTSDFTVVKMWNQTQSEVLGMGGVYIAGDILDGDLMRGEISPYFGSEVKYKVPMGSNVMTMPTLMMRKLCAPAEVSILGRREFKDFLVDVQKWSLSDEDQKAMDRLFTLIDDQLGFSIFENIEQAKRRLSAETQTQFEYKYPGIDIEHPIARSRFEDLCFDSVDKIMDSMDETLKLAQISPEQVDVVCCTGGTAKVPLIQYGMKLRFGKDKIQHYNHYHSVVSGLNLHAQSLG